MSKASKLLDLIEARDYSKIKLGPGQSDWHRYSATQSSEKPKFAVVDKADYYVKDYKDMSIIVFSGTLKECKQWLNDNGESDNRHHIIEIGTKNTDAMISQFNN